MVIWEHMTYAHCSQFPTVSRGTKGYSTDLPPLTDSMSGTWLFCRWQPPEIGHSVYNLKSNF